MEDFDQFKAVFGSRPDITYDQQTIDHVLRNRRLLENELFIDRLLKALGVEKVSKSYPPRSHQDLKILHQRVVLSPSPDHHKQSILYYILKDIAPPDHAPANFAETCFLPERYKIFIDGIWHLDRLKFERALDYLCEPTLTPTFPEEILYTLCRHAPDDNATLPLAYFHTTSPSITSNKVLEAFFSVLCRSSITEAFYFSRSQGELIHQHLFEKLITFVHANAAGALRATRGVELISLPLNEKEEKWFDEFLSQGKGRTLYGAHDTIMIRAIATGRSQDASDQSSHAGNRKIDGLNWAILKESIQHGLGPRKHLKSAIQ